MSKKMLKVGDIFGRGDSRLVVVDMKVVRVSRVGPTNMGVVYVVQQHGPVNGAVVEGNAYTMIGGTEIQIEQSVNGGGNSEQTRTRVMQGIEVRTTRSALKLGGWKLIAGPTFDAREAARKARKAREAVAAVAAYVGKTGEAVSQ
jgi:hypothetical protein